jgi:hypothetical protein
MYYSCIVRRLGLVTCAVAAALLTIASIQAQAPVSVEFNFDEGAGSTVTNRAGTLVGMLGIAPVPENEPLVITQSPSGAAGDTAVELQGNGFLVADDSTTPALGTLHTNAFTLEAWIRISPDDTVSAYNRTKELVSLNQTIEQSALAKARL